MSSAANEYTRLPRHLNVSRSAAPADTPPATPALARAEIYAEVRPLGIALGGAWVRAFGPARYGKRTLADVTDVQLDEIHAAAVAAFAIRKARPAPAEVTAPPVAEIVTPPPIMTRAEVEAEVRPLGVRLGVLWLREFGPRRYGKQKLSDVSVEQLCEIYAAAVEAVAAWKIAMLKAAARDLN